MSQKFMKPLLGAAVASTMLLGPMPAYAAGDAETTVSSEVAEDKGVSVASEALPSTQQPVAVPEAVETKVVQEQAPAVQDSTLESAPSVDSANGDQPEQAPEEVTEQPDTTSDQTAAQNDPTDEKTPADEEAPAVAPQPDETKQAVDTEQRPSQEADPDNTQQQPTKPAEEVPVVPELDVLEQITAEGDIQLPQGSENWTDEQWDAYFESSEGQKLFDELMEYPEFAFDFYVGLLNSAENEEEYTEIWAAISEDLNDRGWLEAFEEYYIGIVTGEETGGEETQPEPKPSTTPEESKPKPSATPEASKPVIKPAGQVKHQEETAAEAAGEPLAQTGSNSLLWAGFGGLLALAGAVLVIRQRRNSAN